MEKDSLIQDSATGDVHIGDVHNNVHNHIVSDINNNYHCLSCKTDHPSEVKKYTCVADIDDCEKTCDSCESQLKNRYQIRYNITGLCGICVKAISDNNQAFLYMCRDASLRNKFYEEDLEDYENGYSVPYFIGENEVRFFREVQTAYTPIWKNYFNQIDWELNQEEERKKNEHIEALRNKQNRDLKQSWLEAYTLANKKPKKTMYVMEIAKNAPDEPNTYYVSDDIGNDEHGKPIPDMNGAYRMVEEIKPLTAWERFKLLFKRV